MESSAPARGSGGSKQKILHRQLVRAHAHPPRGWQGQQNCMRSFWTCAKRMIRSGGMGYPVAREGVDGKLWRVLRDLAITHLTSQGERGPVRSFSLECGGRPRGPLSTLLFDIFMTSWLDCMIRALSMASAMAACSKFVICGRANAILHPNGLQS
jgi:hypothetical protein